MKKLFVISSVLAIAAGIVLVAGGAWALNFTYKNVAQENIVTPDDALIPSTPVRGPLTLKVQADIIRTHALKSAGGKTYAEMSREDPARATWVTATTLITALNLGVISYAFATFTILFGLISLWTGVTFYVLSKKY